MTAPVTEEVADFIPLDDWLVIDEPYLPGTVVKVAKPYLLEHPQIKSRVIVDVDLFFDNKLEEGIRVALTRKQARRLARELYRKADTDSGSA